MRKTLVATLVAFLAGGGFAADWVYTITNGQLPPKYTQGTISDGVWTFNATTASGTYDMTVGMSTTRDSSDWTAPEALDFSKKVVSSTDPSIEFTIIKLNTQFGKADSSKLRVSGSPESGRVGCVTFPESGLTTVGDAAFAGCTNAVFPAQLPLSVTTLGNQSFAKSGLSGDVVALGVTSIGHSAVGGSEITSVRFGPGLTTIGNSYDRGAFSYCTSLTNVVFDANSTIASIGQFTFNGCTALEEIDLSAVRTFDVQPKGDNAQFKDCTALKQVIFGSAITRFPTNLFNLKCTSLREIRFRGLPPVSTDAPVLNTIVANQSVITMVELDPDSTEYDYQTALAAWGALTEGGSINSNDSTWTNTYVKSGVALANRKLLLYAPQQVSVVKGDDADEKTCTPGSFVISRSASSPVATALDVCYSMSGTATNGEAYVELSGVATIPAGESSVTVVVTPLYNPYMKADATATMTIAPSADYDIVGQSTASITVVDGGLLGASVAKGGDADFNQAQSGSFIISRAVGDATVYPVTVSFSAGGTAVAGTDYTALPTTATIPVGATSITVPVVPLYCETQVEGDTTVSLSLADDPTYVVGTRSATVNVKKVEARHYSIAAGANPVGKTRGTFIVSRGADDPIDQKVTLTYTVSGAGTNSIYALSGTVVIPPYASSATIEVFADNASGDDAQLTVTLDEGGYTRVVPAASITVTAGASSEYWLVDTANGTMSWGGWTFNVNINANPATVGCSGKVPTYPATISPLDFSLPAVDSNGKRYVITSLSVRDASAEGKAMAGELTLPGEGFTGFGYSAFNGCTNLCGTLVFPTTCAGLSGAALSKCCKLKILGRSVANWTVLNGTENLQDVSFEGEVLATALTEIENGGFSNSKIESVRFGPGLKTLGRASYNRSGCFEYCSQLTNVTFDAASRVSLEHGATFKHCTSLADIDLSVVTNITCGTMSTSKGDQAVYSTFYQCSALTNVTFGAELDFIASNVFEQAFKSLTAPQSVTFKGLPPEHLELPFLSKLSRERNPQKVYVFPTVTTYVHRKYLNKRNAAGKCWLDYAAGGEINRKDSTWASDYLPAEVTDLTVRPLRVIEPLGLQLFVR